MAFIVFLLVSAICLITEPGWRAALLGGAAAALAYQAVQVGLDWYLWGPVDFANVYGSTSAVFAFLFSVYLSATAFVVCAIFSRTLDETVQGHPLTSTLAAVVIFV